MFLVSKSVSLQLRGSCGQKGEALFEKSRCVFGKPSCVCSKWVKVCEGERVCLARVGTNWPCPGNNRQPRASIPKQFLRSLATVPLWTEHPVRLEFCNLRVEFFHSEGGNVEIVFKRMKPEKCQQYVGRMYVKVTHGHKWRETSYFSNYLDFCFNHLTCYSSDPAEPGEVGQDNWWDLWGAPYELQHPTGTIRNQRILKDNKLDIHLISECVSQLMSGDYP